MGIGGAEPAGLSRRPVAHPADRQDRGAAQNATPGIGSGRRTGNRNIAAQGIPLGRKYQGLAVIRVPCVDLPRGECGEISEDGS